LSVENKGVLPDFQHNQCTRPFIGADRQGMGINEGTVFILCSYEANECKYLNIVFLSGV
jgi:hypothetical protein